MSAIDVLARALFETAKPKGKWDPLLDLVKDDWRDQALVVADRMVEAEPPPREPVFFTLPEPGSLEEATTVLLTTAEALNATGTAAIDATDWQDAVRILHRLREATDHIGAVTALLTRHIYLTGEHGDQDIEGVGRVKIIRGRDRTQWEPREAVFAYIDARMIATEGEVPDPMVVADWVMDVLPATSSTSCKVTALKNMGLDPKAFCEDSPGSIRVDLPPRS